MTNLSSILTQLLNFLCNYLYLVIFSNSGITTACSNDCWHVLYVRCDPGALTDALCKRVMVTPEEVIKRSLDPYSATISRDGLAKTIYSRLFDW
jgi:myosin heavy subunit